MAPIKKIVAAHALELRRVGVELEPPDEKGQRLVNPPTSDHEPGRPKLWLESETPGGPLGSCPKEGKHDHRDKKELPPKYFRRGHRCGPHPCGASATHSWQRPASRNCG